MIYRNCILHAITDIEDTGKKRILHRLPETVRNKLESPPNVSREHAASEIRFIIKDKVTIRLSSCAEAEEWRFAKKSGVMVYFGDYQYNYYLVPPEGIVIELEPVYAETVAEKLLLTQYCFSPHLVRLQLYNSISFDDISGGYSLPDETDVPARKYLAYGTSITQGRLSISPDLSFPAILGNLTGYDVYNYGMGGACLLEDSIADFLCSESYSLISLCLSVNMLNKGYRAEVFSLRLRKLLAALRRKNPEALFFLLSIVTHWRDMDIMVKPFDWNKGENSGGNGGSAEDCKLYRGIVEQAGRDFGAVFVEGEKILSAPRLSADLLHPANYGAIEMAYKLYELYKNLTPPNHIPARPVTAAR
jgi:lysophospholipase L1-like esterase